MTLSSSTVPYHELVLWLFFALLLIAGIVVARFWTGDKPVGVQRAVPGDASSDRPSWRDALQSMQANSELDGRMRAVEQALLHVPSSTDFAELEGTVRMGQVQYDSLAEGQKAIRATLFRIEDFLLKGNRP